MAVQVCDLALLTVRDDAFWGEEMRALEFVDVPELQVGMQESVGVDSIHE
jgi:hypothetical protein